MTILKAAKDLAALREGGAILARTLAAVAAAAVPGATPLALDALAEKTIREAGGEPAFKGYQGFPATLCVSVNTAVVHGIPTAKPLADGDVVGLDCGVRYKGYITDAAVTVGVGTLRRKARRLIEVTEKAFWIAHQVIRAGVRTGDVGHAVQTYVEAQGFSVVRALVGHGVGEHVHEDPKVPNYGSPGSGALLPEGIVIAVEPMVTAGHYDVTTATDGWTVQTADHSLAAHYEHTLVVTATGAEVVTAL